MINKRIHFALLSGAMILCFFFIADYCCSVDVSGDPPEPAAARDLNIAPPIQHPEMQSWEPMIAELPDGSLLVSGFKVSKVKEKEVEEPTIWKSSDGGTTGVLLNVGTKKDGAAGNSDSDLAVSQDGIIYYATMVYDVKEAEGKQISIAVSKDAGKTWKWTLLSKVRFSDRPWVKVAPNGTAHVIWNNGSGVCHAVSEDSGLTWKERAKIHPRGGSSHLAVGPNNEIAVRITPFSASGRKYEPGVDLIAVSTDNGKTWQKYPAPGIREWNPEGFPLPRWVEPLAWDANGTLYSFWTNIKGLWLARSYDKGATWKIWHLRESPELEFFPYLVARGPNELAVTWFSGWTETLHAHVARIDVDKDDATPRMTESPPFKPDSWNSQSDWPDNPPYRSPAGEYLAVSFLRKGGLAVVSTIRNKKEKRFGFTFWKVEKHRGEPPL